MNKKQPKFPYIAAWDEMMCSGEYWCKMNQTRAANDPDASHTVIYQDSTNHWHKFEDIGSEHAKSVIEQIMKRHGWK